MRTKRPTNGSSPTTRDAHRAAAAPLRLMASAMRSTRSGSQASSPSRKARSEPAASAAPRFLAGRRTPVRLADHPNPWGISLGDLGRPIGGAVIDDDAFDVRIRLHEHALDRLGDERTSVENRDDCAYAGGRHAAQAREVRVGAR